LNRDLDWALRDNVTVVLAESFFDGLDGTCALRSASLTKRQP
jgi:hypothetical protein